MRLAWVIPLSVRICENILRSGMRFVGIIEQRCGCAAISSARKAQDAYGNKRCFKIIAPS